MATPAYRFTDLGWLQFERVCIALMDTRSGVASDGWMRHADGVRSLLVEGDLKHPRTGELIAGPVCVAISWWGPRTTNRRVHFQRVVRQAASLPYFHGPGPMRLLVLTNIDADGRSGWGPGDAAHVIDAHGLGAIVDDEPELRRRCPSLLGVRGDLDALVSAEVLARSTFDDGAAVSLAPIFVPTPAHAQTLTVLAHYGFAVLTGPPEMGKTAIARMVGLAQLTDGWEVHECVRPSELWERFDRDHAQVFIADDAFGSTEYQPESAERWARELDGILRAMDDRHWLIWTSRPAPLRAGLRRVHRERGAERFPQPAEVQIAASELDAAHKALILFRHTRAAELDRAAIELVQEYGDLIVEHPHFTPERIRRFVGGRLSELAHVPDRADHLVTAAVDAEIQEPTVAMKASFEALSPEHRALLIALLDTSPGPVEEREIAAATRRHSDTGFPRPPSELIDRLADHFVRLVPPTSITWVHPSWRDLVIEQLRGDHAARRKFLQRCEIHGLVLALSVEGGAAGERSFPLLVTDRDWDALTDRTLELLPGLETVQLFRLLSTLGESPQDLEPHTARELGALRRTMLDAVREIWDERAEPISATLLESWFAAAATLDPRPATPALGTTWIEVLPVGPVDTDSPNDVSRWEEWLALVRVLVAHGRKELEAFGYPERQAGALEQLMSQAFIAARTSDPGEPEPLVRLVRQVLALPIRMDWSSAVKLEAWVSDARDLTEMPRLDRPPTAVHESQSSIVDRILRDLEAAIYEE